MLPMNWNDFRYFLVVARTGSLTEAARILLVTPSTVSRRIDELERSVRQTLFSRRQTGYTLSDAGAALVPIAEGIEARALAFERAATSSEQPLDGLARITTPELLGNEFLLPRLAPFLRDNPQLRLDFLADVRPVRLAHQEVDVLLRVTRPEHGRYKLRRVGQMAMGLYGSDTYLAGHAEPLAWADLSDHAVIGWVEDLQFLAHARWLEDKLKNYTPRLRTGSMVGQLKAAVAGLGLSVLPSAIAKEAGLRRVLPSEPLLRLDLWLATSEELSSIPRVRAVADAIAAVLHRERDSLDPPD